VAGDNLGTLAGLVTAASLMIDSVLPVSVSIASGVAQITSLVPDWLTYTVPTAVAAVVLIMLGNLRGIRESGRIFATSTYLFVGMMFVLIAYGLYRLADGDVTYVPPASVKPPGAQAMGVFLLLSAFAQGCTAMTGAEAISNGVPAFKPPEAYNAQVTLAWMGMLLGTTFLDLSYLAVQIGVLPADGETVISHVERLATEVAELNVGHGRVGSLVVADRAAWVVERRRRASCCAMLAGPFCGLAVPSLTPAHAGCCCTSGLP
jgi:amino acid transporter